MQWRVCTRGQCNGMVVMKEGWDCSAGALRAERPWAQRWLRPLEWRATDSFTIHTHCLLEVTLSITVHNEIINPREEVHEVRLDPCAQQHKGAILRYFCCWYSKEALKCPSTQRAPSHQGTASGHSRFPALLSALPKRGGFDACSFANCLHARESGTMHICILAVLLGALCEDKGISTAQIAC